MPKATHLRDIDGSIIPIVGPHRDTDLTAQLLASSGGHPPHVMEITKNGSACEATISSAVVRLVLAAENTKYMVARACACISSRHNVAVGK